MARRDLKLRLATPADGAALCALFASVPMEGALTLAVDRRPDYFALYDLQGGARAVFVLEENGQLVGTATLLARDGYLDGQRIRVGYAGDLRLAASSRGGFVLGRRLGPAFAEAAGRLGVQVSLTAVISSNRAAQRALVRRQARFPGSPVYRLLRRFDILNLQLVRPVRPRQSGLSVRCAQARDLADIAAFLHADHRSRPFGYVLDEAELRRRLATWPGLAIAHFYLVHDGPVLVGVAAAWDAGAVKRLRAVRYGGAMRWARVGLGALAVLTRASRLPAPGAVFRYVYLTHVSIRDEDPRIMGALIERIYADHYGRGFHFITACVYENDPLAAAFARFTAVRLPAELHTMTLPGAAAPDVGARWRRPGFEMALV